MAFENSITSKGIKLKSYLQSQLDLNIVYGIRMKIPEIVLFNAGEPKYWYYQDKVNPESTEFL